MPMHPSEVLRSTINRHAAALVAAIPADRSAALLALVHTIDGQPKTHPSTADADPVTGIPVTGLGNSRALQFLLTGPYMSGHAVADLDLWATTFLTACEDLARAEFVLVHVETGFMRLQTDVNGDLEARIVQRATPIRWRERADDNWWDSWLEERYPLPESAPLVRATALVDRLALRYDLPEDGCIAGVDLGLARRVLAHLMITTERDEQGLLVRDILVRRLAESTGAEAERVSAVLDALTLDAPNAAWHAAVPGIADPPLVRAAAGEVVTSRRGAGNDPFRFLTRELRRRDPESYHAAAAFREQRFRSDLYDLFSHRRFVTSSGSIELRREKGSIRTDIDAAIFDRKSGILALFELKTNEPFARSTAELIRTQESTKAASRQVSNVLDWINRNGADEILNRIDRQTAKGFRVQKVQAFVLGRHLMEGDSQRAVWATWPQVLRVLGSTAVEDLGGNPIVTLAARLGREQPLVSPVAIRRPTIVKLGNVNLVVHPLK